MAAMPIVMLSSGRVGAHSRLYGDGLRFVFQLGRVLHRAPFLVLLVVCVGGADGLAAVPVRVGKRRRLSFQKLGLSSDTCPTTALHYSFLAAHFKNNKRKAEQAFPNHLMKMK